MKILVTGGAGYIGSHTIRSLIRFGHEPVAIDNLKEGKIEVLKKKLKVPHIISDIGNKEILKEIIFGEHNSLRNTPNQGQMIDAVMHFAADTNVKQSFKKPLKYYENNVENSIKLLDVLCSKDVRSSRKNNLPIPIIFSSSCATYGSPNSIPVHESFPQNPISPYGKSKLMVETIIKDLAKSHNLQSVILRYFNAAGASEDSLLGEDHSPETHLIPRVIMAALGQQKEINIYGDNYPTPDGTCIRDYIHVEDLANAHVLALKLFSNFNKANNYQDENEEKNCFEFNVGLGKGISVKEIIKIVDEMVGKVPYSIKNKREGDPPVLIASSEKIKRVLGWNPKYENTDEIIYHAYKWIKKNCSKKN